MYWLGVILIGSFNLVAVLFLYYFYFIFITSFILADELSVNK